MIKSFISSLILTVAICISPMSMADNQSDIQQTEVNINTAEAQELDKYLDGVGKTKAQAIIDHREKNGLFKSIDSLLDVKGIGDGILKKNRDKITL